MNINELGEDLEQQFAKPLNDAKLVLSVRHRNATTAASMV